MTVGELVVSLREEKGLSSKELSTLSGVPKTTLSDLENNKHRPRTSTVKKILATLLK